MTDISRVLFDLRHFSDLCPMCCMQQNEANQSFSNAFGRKTKTLEVCFFWNPWIQTEVSKRLPSLLKAKSSWAWWHLFSILVLWRLKQENKELEVTLGNIVKTLSQTKTMNNKQILLSLWILFSTNFWEYCPGLEQPVTTIKSYGVLTECNIA